MKANAITRIVIYSVILVLLIGLLWVCLRQETLTVSLGGSGKPVSGEASVSASEVHDLEIDWASGSVAIVTADTDTVTFSESGGSSENPMTYDLSGGTLQLAYGKGTVQIGIISMPSKDLTVTVPKDWDCEELEINAASVDVDITGLTVAELSLNGEANKLRFSGSIDSLDCDGASNDIELECAASPREISIDGASCSLDLTLPYDCGFRATLDGLSCDFDSDLDYTSSDGTYRYGDEGCKIDVDGVSCDVTVNAQEAGYAITAADNGTEELLLEPLDGLYPAGSTVTVKSGFADWATLQLWVNGEYVCDETSVQDGDFVYASFTFTMPDRDAVIELKWVQQDNLVIPEETDGNWADQNEPA